MKVLLTGGAGYIWCHIIVSLINSGYDVIAYDNFSKSNKNNFKSVEDNLNNELQDGTPRKLLDSSILNKLGWNSNFKLDDELKLTYENYLKEMLTN